jgi:CRISPR system Cascade subunit CasE
LRANPTIKKQAENKKNGYRLGLLREEDQINWLGNKAAKGGFILISCQANPEGIIHEAQNKNEDKLSHYAVRFEGVLQISDPDIFLGTISNGIGSAKGFGFGLLSIAPIKE